MELYYPWISGPLRISWDDNDISAASPVCFLRCLESRFVVRSDSNRHRFAAISNSTIRIARVSGRAIRFASGLESRDPWFELHDSRHLRSVYHGISQEELCFGVLLPFSPSLQPPKVQCYSCCCLAVSDSHVEISSADDRFGSCNLHPQPRYTLSPYAFHVLHHGTAITLFHYIEEESRVLGGITIQARLENSLWRNEFMNVWTMKRWIFHKN